MGPKKQGFWPRINIIEKKSLHFMNAMNFVLSKSAKIYLIFCVKNWQNFLIFFSLMNINSGDHFLLKTFFSNLNFWTTLLLNEGIPRALKGKKLCLKIPRVLPLFFELFLVFQIWGQNTIGGQFLEHFHLIWNCPWFLKFEGITCKK